MSTARLWLCGLTRASAVGFDGTTDGAGQHGSLFILDYLPTDYSVAVVALVRCSNGSELFVCTTTPVSLCMYRRASRSGI